jgi:hypothetical protein
MTYLLTVSRAGPALVHFQVDRVFEALSLIAPDRAGETVVVDSGFVETNLGELIKSTDLRRYVLSEVFDTLAVSGCRTILPNPV